MKIIKNMILEMVVIHIVLAIAWFTSAQDEVKCIFSEGISGYICVMGILLGVMAFFRLLGGNMHNVVASFLTGVTLFIFGHFLQEDGFFMAIAIVGVVLFIMSWLSFPLVPILGQCLFVIGIIFFVIGYPLRNVTEPPQSPEEIELLIKTGGVSPPGRHGLTD